MNIFFSQTKKERKKSQCQNIYSFKMKWYPKKKNERSQNVHQSFSAVLKRSKMKKKCKKIPHECQCV